MKKTSEIEFIVTQKKVYVVIDGIKQESDKIVGADATLLWAQLVLESSDLRTEEEKPDKPKLYIQCSSYCDTKTAERFGLIPSSRCTGEDGHPTPRNMIGHYYPRVYSPDEPSY